MRFFLTLFSALLLLNIAAVGQYQSPPVWLFGDHAGLDFRGGAPTPASSALSTHSSRPAIQCDDNGDVLFYADGLGIRDAAGSVMPGSENPIWNNYRSGWNLNAAIVPHATDTNKYYVFNTFPSKGDPPYGAYFSGQLTYSVVDMSLNGGMGGVVSGQTHILLDKNTGHYMTVISGSKCNYWVVVQTGFTTRDYSFKCYRVDEQGVSTTPVVSPFPVVPALNPNGNGTAVGARAGNIIYSHTRDKIIVSYESSDVTAYDFDRATGKVSNAVALLWPYKMAERVSSSTIPAICLSPDEQFLYTSGYSSTNPGAGFVLNQYPLSMFGGQLSAGTPVTIFNPASRKFLAVEDGNGIAYQKSAMQLGPDNKIYHCFTMGQSFVGCIEQPNTAGLACSFLPDKVKLQTGTFTTSSLPAPAFERKLVERGESTAMDTTACFDEPVILEAPQGYAYYEWQDGSDTMSYNTNTEGVYYVISTDKKCRKRTDSFKVNYIDFDVSLGPDIASCYDTTLKILTDIPQGAGISWQDGSAMEEYPAQDYGEYYVTVSSGKCVASDTLNYIQEEFTVALPEDTVICTDNTIRLDVSTENASYMWQDGSADAYYDVHEMGTYSVALTLGKCRAEDEIYVDEMYCENCLAGVPNAFTPNKDGLNDNIKPVFFPRCVINNYTFSIYNRFGERVFYTTDPKQGWDGLYKGFYADVGSYYYYLTFTDQQQEEYLKKGDVLLLR